MKQAEPRVIREIIVWSKRCREHFSPWHMNAPEDTQVAETGISDLYPGYKLERVKPRFHLLVYTEQGRGLFYTETYSAVIRPGQVLIVPAGTPFGYVPHGGRWRFTWYHLPDNVHWARLRGARPMIRRTFIAQPLQEATEGFVRESQKKGAIAKRAAQLYAELIDLYLHREFGAGEEPPGSSVAGRLENLWACVRENLTRDWAVEDLAEQMSMTPSHLYRIVRRHTGTSPMKYVTRLRMEHAQELLVTLECTIRVVADMVGYQNEFAFAVAFKRFSGVTPGAFRKRK